MKFLPEKIDLYACNHTQVENTVLAELSRETWAKVLIPRMLSGHLQGRTLSMFSQMIQPKTILEIGTYTGYSAICLAEGLQENGSLHTIDINEELKSMCERYFEKAGISKKVKLHNGNAMQIIPTIDAEFDLVFIDADKENYINYFDLIIERIPVGGYIIADNVLWSGKVVEEVDTKDIETQGLIAFNQKMHESERLENLLLPIRDGLMVCRKIK